MATLKYKLERILNQKWSLLKYFLSTPFYQIVYKDIKKNIFIKPEKYLLALLIT